MVQSQSVNLGLLRIGGNQKKQSEIAREFDIHPITVGKWKTELLERMPGIFENKSTKKKDTSDQEKQGLERKVGQLTMEVEFLEKKCNQLEIPFKGRA